MSGSSSKKETLEYVRSLLADARYMTGAEGCDMLTYLVELAYAELEDILNGDRPFVVRTGAELKLLTDVEAA